MAFRIVHFVRDDSVECVPKSWLEDTANGTMCYWPAKDQKRLIKSLAEPDRELWKKYSIRCLGRKGYEDYNTARYYLKKAEETSNIDSEQEEVNRKRKKPHRFLEECSSDSDEFEPKRPVSGAKHSNDNTERFPLPLSPTIRIRSSPQCGTSSPTTTPHRMTTPNRTSVTTPNRPSVTTPNRPSVTTPNRPSVTTPNRPLVTTCTPNRALSPLPQDNNMLTQVLDHLKRLEASVNDIKKALNLDDKEETTMEDFLPNGKLDSPQEMGTFSAKFESTESRKGLVRWLASLQGGEDIGLICRTTMRAFMTNKLMSFYSVKGQKGKLPFNKTTAYSIVLKSVKRACRGKVSLSDVMLEVGDVLRNAPNKPGGINYIKKQHQNKQNKEFERTTEMEGDDSDASISD